MHKSWANGYQKCETGQILACHIPPLLTDKEEVKEKMYCTTMTLLDGIVDKWKDIYTLIFIITYPH